jgi:hypothetical protein
MEQPINVYGRGSDAVNLERSSRYGVLHALMSP